MVPGPVPLGVRYRPGVAAGRSCRRQEQRAKEVSASRSADRIRYGAQTAAAQGGGVPIRDRDAVLGGPLDRHDLKPADRGMWEASGDVPSATAILDRFLYHAEVINITGKSYRLQDRSCKGVSWKHKSEPGVAAFDSIAGGPF